MAGPRGPSENTNGASILGDKSFPYPKQKKIGLFESSYATTSDKDGGWTPVGHQNPKPPAPAPRSSIIAGDLAGKGPTKVMSPTSMRKDYYQPCSGPAISETSTQPKSNERKDLAVPTMAVNKTTTLPPHLRANLHLHDKKSVPTKVPKADIKPGLIPINDNGDCKLTLPSAPGPVNQSGSSPTCVAHTAQPNKKEPVIPPKPTIPPPPSLNRLLKEIVSMPSPIPPPSPAAAPGGASAWANLAGSSSLVVNRPARATDPYNLPAQFSGSTYGTPRIPRPPTAPTDTNAVTERTLFLKSWPGVENRGNRSMPRTIVISDLPRDPTLTMISSICKNTGLIESISLIPSRGKAMVWFIEATDAQKLHNRSGNGVEFTYSRDEKTHKHVVFIDMGKDLDVLASTMRTNVTDKGHTRVIRIVGWIRKDLELLSGVKGVKDEPYGVLLKRLAEKCCIGGKVYKVEGVAAEVNSLGYNEARLIFSGIKEAYYALGQLKRKTELEACNITFGRDPCEPEASPHS